MKPLYRRLISSTTIVTALVLTACSDSSGPGESSLPGTYALRTMNGSAIPVTFSESGVSFRVNSGSLTLTSSNTFVTNFNFTVTVPGQAAVTESTSCGGTYQRVQATGISFNTVGSEDCEGGITTGSWDSENTITIEEDGDQLVFRR